MTKRAVLYARVSGDDRHTEGRNLLSQLEMCREHAKKKGYDIVAELAEDERGASGATINLPQLLKALDMAHDDHYDVLVVREIDRFSRRLAKQLILGEELKRAGVVIDYVLAEYPDTPEGNRLRNLEASVAERERLKTIERMVRGRRNKARAGHVVLHGHAPFGYRRAEVDDRVTLAVDEDEANVVRLIYDLYLNDGLSAYATAKRLTEIGVPTPTGRSKRWQSGTVAQLLDDEVYAGTWYYGKGVHLENPQETWIPVNVPAIVSRERWERTQAKRADMRRSYNHGNNIRYKYLLRGHVVCGHCGAPMRCSKRRGNKYYSCPVGTGSQHQVSRDCDESKHFWAEVLDAQIWKRARTWLLNTAELRCEIERFQAKREQMNTPLHTRLDICRELLAENRAKLARLLDLYLDGTSERELLVTRRAELEKVIADVGRERDVLTAQLASVSVTEERVRTLNAFAARTRQRQVSGEEGFDDRREILKLLDVRVRLWMEDGEQVARLNCSLLGKDEMFAIRRSEQNSS